MRIRCFSFSEFIKVISNLFYNFIEFIILLFTFLVICFALYKEYMIRQIPYSNFWDVLSVFTRASPNDQTLATQTNKLGFLFLVSFFTLETIFFQEILKDPKEVLKPFQKSVLFPFVLRILDFVDSSNSSILSFKLIFSSSDFSSERILLWIYFPKDHFLFCHFQKTMCHTFSYHLFYKLTLTAQKIKFFIKDFFSKCHLIRRKLRIWSRLLKKSLMKNFIFCAVSTKTGIFEGTFFWSGVFKFQK